MKMLIVEVVTNKSAKGQPLHEQEVIDFGSILFYTDLNSRGVGFSTLIRPTYNKIISDYCSERTGLFDFDFDEKGNYLDFVNTIDLSEYLDNLDCWGYWCNKTKELLEIENQRWNISPDFFYLPAINLKELFCKQMEVGKMTVNEAHGFCGFDKKNLPNVSGAYLKASKVVQICKIIDFTEVDLNEISTKAK